MTSTSSRPDKTVLRLAIKKVESARGRKLEFGEAKRLLGALADAFRSAGLYDLDSFGLEFERLANNTVSASEEKAEARRVRKAVETLLAATIRYRESARSEVLKRAPSLGSRVRSDLVDDMLDGYLEEADRVLSATGAVGRKSKSREHWLLWNLAETFASFTDLQAPVETLSAAKGSRFISFAVAVFEAYAPHENRTPDNLSKLWKRLTASAKI